MHEFSPLPIRLDVANSVAELTSAQVCFIRDAYCDGSSADGFKIEVERFTYDTADTGRKRDCRGPRADDQLGSQRIKNSVTTVLAGQATTIGIGLRLWNCAPSTGRLGRDDGRLVAACLSAEGRSVDYSMTQKPLASSNDRLSQCNKPEFGRSQGVPADSQLRNGGFRVGLNYHLQ